MRALLERAGFEDIHVVKLKQPFGMWAKEKRLKQVGTMNVLNGETGAPPPCPRLAPRVMLTIPQGSMPTEWYVVGGVRRAPRF